MSNPPFPNPAEVCKSRGWQVGDKIKARSCPVREITFIGHDYIHTYGEGVPNTFRKESDITHWTKVEPRPVVTWREDRGSEVYVLRDGIEIIRISPTYGSCGTAFAGIDMATYGRIGAEAIKAAIEGDQPQRAEKAEGPYDAARDSDNSWFIRRTPQGPGIGNHGGVWVSRRACNALGHDATGAIVERHAREMAAELNALHAKANVKADQT